MISETKQEVNTRIVSFEFWRKWLIGAAGFVVVFSLDFLILPKQMTGFYSWVFFGDAASQFSATADNYIIFLYGLIGSIMLGWMINVIFMLIGPFRRKELFAWRSIILSIIVWFCADSAASLFYGFGANAAMNVGFLAIFLIPLLATRNDFVEEKGDL